MISASMHWDPGCFRRRLPTPDTWEKSLQDLWYMSSVMVVDPPRLVTPKGAPHWNFWCKRVSKIQPAEVLVSPRRRRGRYNLWAFLREIAIVASAILRPMYAVAGPKTGWRDTYWYFFRLFAPVPPFFSELAPIPPKFVFSPIVAISHSFCFVTCRITSYTCIQTFHFSCLSLQDNTHKTSSFHQTSIIILTGYEPRSAQYHSRIHIHLIY